MSDLLDELWAEFPDYDQWDVDRTYTSQRLGSSSGTRGFVYMLSDRVFGGMPSNEIDDPGGPAPGRHDRPEQRQPVRPGV